MQKLGEGVYSLDEQEELFRRRRADIADVRQWECMQEVLKNYAGLGGAISYASFPDDFKLLVDWAFKYQSAKLDADLHRATNPIPDSLALAVRREHDAKEEFIAAWKKYWQKDR